MQAEIKINKQSIFYEVIESELEYEYESWTEIVHPEKKSKTYMITFSLDFPEEGLSKNCGKELWYRIRKQFIRFQNKNSEISEKNYIIRISYKYSGTRFECEFYDLLDTEIDTLHNVNTFAEMFPGTKDIRIIRNGPIILRFFNDSKKNRRWDTIRKIINDFR